MRSIWRNEGLSSTSNTFVRAAAVVRRVTEDAGEDEAAEADGERAATDRCAVGAMLIAKSDVGRKQLALVPRLDIS